jgi:hypothetical protein
MRAFNNFLNTARQVMSIGDDQSTWVNEVIERNDMSLRRDDSGAVAFDINPEDEVLMQLSELGQLQLMQTYVLLEMVKSGPKVLNIKDNYVAPLLNTELNISISDYNQPYNFMCVNLPPQFMQKYISEYEDDAYGNGPGQHSPDCVLVCHDNATKAIVIHVIFSSSQSITTMLVKGDDIEKQVNECLDNRLDGSANIDETEAVAAIAAMKIALNGLLLADGNLTPLGPCNQSYYDRLVRLKKKRCTPAQAKSNTTELAIHPFVFEINQNVQTYNKSAASESTWNRGTNKPHWRRGHYRMQRFGPELTEQKRIRIVPVLVNYHLFLGSILDSKADYELNTPIPQGNTKG